MLFYGGGGGGGRCDGGGVDVVVVVVVFVVCCRRATQAQGRRDTLPFACFTAVKFFFVAHSFENGGPE